MSDLISRAAAIDALAEAMPSLTTPDGCGQFDHDIQVTDEAYVDCMQIIHDLPSAQRWIPCSTALPRDEEEVIVSIHDDSGDYACDYTSFGWYAAAGKFWVVDNEVNMRVTAWMPLPKPWEGGQDES